jgi:alcohol dehydrogenase class IV
MNLPFEFATATRIVFGAGRLQELPGLAKPFGRRAFIVTGRSLDRARPLIEALASAGISASTFSVAGEPEVATVVEGVAQAKKANSDLVISFGGGSAIDAGKAIAATLTNQGNLLDYLEVIGQGRALETAPAPFIAIPTTAGTGSEVTRNAVLASPEHRVKVSLRSPFMLPRVALIDPQLTYGLPPAITASTGLDALTQVIEPYVCARPNPMTDSLCYEGIRRAAKALPLVFGDGQNTQAREDMAVASLFGGLALANAGLGAVHGFAGPIGGMFAAPHGAVCAALLPYVMEVNLRALTERQAKSETLARYQTVAQLLTGNPSAGAEEGPSWVHTLTRKLQIPGLSAYGITPDHIPEMVDKSSKASSMKANPIALTPKELAEILERAL